MLTIEQEIAQKFVWFLIETCVAKENEVIWLFFVYLPFFLIKTTIFLRMPGLYRQEVAHFCKITRSDGHLDVRNH